LGDIAERQEAFVETITESGEAPAKGYMRATINNPQGGGDALAELLDLAQSPTAVVFATDVLALGALHEAHNRGLRIPDDISVTGFDDIPLAAYAVPALTTVHMPVPEMVAAAVSMVIDDENGRAALPAHPVLTPSLVVRDSTAPPAA
jgi:DNA-binding LacI/PurR family transcriptional regulator